MSYQNAIYRSLPENYDEFLCTVKDGGGFIEYQTETLYVYGKVISENTVLYISAPLGAVGAAAVIIRIQPVWVTAAALLVAFVLSYVKQIVSCHGGECGAKSTLSSGCEFWILLNE